MKKNTYIIGAVFSILLVSTILAMSGVFSSIGNAASSDNEINYYSDVCKQVVRVDGTIEPMECSHNLLTTAGKNAIRDAINGTSVPFSWIGLCNSSFGGSCTTPAGADTTLGNEYNDASGLNRSIAATYLALGTGNWSYSRTFVALADGLTTNLTGIFNVTTTGGTLLAVNQFTASTLQTNDQITINWSVWVQ